MEIIPIEPISIIAIFIIIATLIFAYIRKWMMTYALIIANIIIFILTFIFYYETPVGDVSILIVDLGFRPIYLSSEYFPQLYTIFTSMFIHGGIWHIFMNMFIFVFIGTAFEQRIGAKKFLVIYLLSGFCGTLAHSLLDLDSTTVLIGASGAIFGIMGAFAYSYPRDRIIMPLPILGLWVIHFLKNGLRVIHAVLLFAVIETLYVLFSVQDQTAHVAHLGGLVGGFILAALLIRTRGEPKFDSSQAFSSTYYEPTQFQRPKAINFSNLEKLATTDELKQMLRKVKDETVPQVRDIWLDHFLEKAKCPKCGHLLNFFDGKIWCKNCDFKTKY